MDFDAQTLLLVEDNEDDVFIFRRAYRQAELKNPVQVVTDGEEACDYLLGRGKFADRSKHPLPKVILLDLKLPFKSGFEVLQTIRETPSLMHLLVIVLTSSAEERDIARALELKAHAYLVKPPSAQTLSQALQAARAYHAGVPAAEIPRIAGDMFDENAVISRKPTSRED